MGRMLLPAEQQAITASLNLCREIARTVPGLYSELLRIEEGEQEGHSDRAHELLGVLGGQVQHLRDRMNGLG